MKILSIKTRRRLIGNIGERAAARFLKKKGFRRIIKNYVAKGHEIDIIAESRELIAFVEVKTVTVGKEDPRRPRPGSLVTPEKQRSIIGAAKYYLATRDEPKPARMDVIEVFLTDGKHPRVNSINHLEYAFNFNSAFPKRFRKD